MNEEPFAPMPTPPPELARGLGWRSVPTPDEIEEAAALDLFSRTTAASNPWTATSVMKVVDEEAQAEQEFEDSIAPVKKLFQPKHTAAAAPNVNLTPTPIKQDDDQQEYYASLAPLQKLFAGNGITTTAASTEVANRFQFTKRATVPAPEVAKSFTGLDSYNEEAQAAMTQAIMLIDSQGADELESEYFGRINSKLVEMGHRPMLPTSVSTDY